MLPREHASSDEGNEDELAYDSASSSSFFFFYLKCSFCSLLIACFHTLGACYNSRLCIVNSLAESSSVDKHRCKCNL